MLFSVFGTPSPITSFVLQAAQAALTAAYGSHDYIAASVVDELRERWQHRSSEHVLFFSDSPEQALVSVFVANQAPLIAVFDNPVELVGHLMQERDCNLITAIRTAALSLATTRSIAASGRSLAIMRDSVSTSAAVMETVFRAFKIDDVEAFEAAIETLGLDRQKQIDDVLTRRFPRAKPMGHWARTFETDNLFLIRAALEGLSSEDGIALQVNWPAGLFLRTGSIEIPADEPINLVGPARHLIHGPYLSLPAGRWAAEIRFSISDNKSGNIIGADCCASGMVLAEGDAELPAQGELKASLAFEVSEPRAPLEIRLAIKEGAIEGVFQFKGVTLRFLQ